MSNKQVASYLLQERDTFCEEFTRDEVWHSLPQEKKDAINRFIKSVNKAAFTLDSQPTPAAPESVLKAYGH